MLGPGYEYAWRGECLRWGLGVPDQTLITSRLLNALQAGRLSASEHEDLSRMLTEHVFATDWVSSRADFREPYASLLWRAGILKRGPQSWPSLIGWLTVYAALCMAFLKIAGEFSLSQLHLDGTTVDVFAAMTMAVLALRPFYNRLYKGEWLVDEALAFLRSLLLMVGGLNVPLMLLLAILDWDRAHVLLSVVILVLILASVSALQAGLWLFGRSPYKNFWYMNL